MATVPVGSSIPAEAEDEALWEAEDERFSDWEEEIDARAQSLFDSTAIFPSAAACLAHDRSHYSFDLVNLAQRLNLDSFGCIKLVNYLRIQQCSAEEANALQDPSILDDESLFRPVIQDDALLQLDFDDLLEDQQQQPQPDNATVQAKQIQQLKEAYENLKLAYQKRIEESDGSASTSGSSDDDRREASSRRQGRRLQRNEKKEKQPDFDSHYFNSYSQNECAPTKCFQAL